MEVEILKRASAYIGRKTCSRNRVPAVQELAADGFPLAVTCRMLKVPRSGYYEWRDRPPSARQSADVELIALTTGSITSLAAPSALTYGRARDRHVEKKRVAS